MTSITLGPYAFLACICIPEMIQTNDVTNVSQGSASLARTLIKIRDKNYQNFENNKGCLQSSNSWIPYTPWVSTQTTRQLRHQHVHRRLGFTHSSLWPRHRGGGVGGMSPRIVFLIFHSLHTIPQTPTSLLVVFWSNMRKVCGEKMRENTRTHRCVDGQPNQAGEPGERDSAGFILPQVKLTKSLTRKGHTTDKLNHTRFIRISNWVFCYI